MVVNPRPLPTSIRLDPELKTRLEIAAASDGRSLSNLIDRVLRAWLDGTVMPPRPEAPGSE